MLTPRRAAALLLILAAACATPALAQSAAPAPAQPGVPVGPEIKREPPPVAAEPPTINLGVMDPGSSKTGGTSLKNTGTEPIKIARVHSSCSCTVPTDITGKTIAPGEALPMEATLKGGNYPGGQQRTVQVFVEGYAVPVRVWVVGEVAYGVRSNPIYVDCFQTRKGKIVFESVDNAPFRILSVNGDAPVFEDFDPAKDEPRTRYTLAYDYSAVQDPATLPQWWLVVTDHPKAPVVDLRVINPANIPPAKTGMEKWTPADDRVIIGHLDPSAPREVNVLLHVRGVDTTGPKPTASTESPVFSVEVVDGQQTTEGYQARLRITLKDPAAAKGGGLVHDLIKINWADHEDTIRAFGRVSISPAG